MKCQEYLFGVGTVGKDTVEVWRLKVLDNLSISSNEGIVRNAQLQLASVETEWTALVYTYYKRKFLAVKRESV